MFGAFRMRTEEIEGLKQAVQAVIRLLKEARKEVWISTGLHQSFYNSSEIKEAIVKTAERVESIRVLIDGDAEEKTREVPTLLRLDKVEIRESKKIPHWTVIDGTHFRLEKPHPVDPMGEGEVGKSLIVWNMDPAISRILKEVWIKWWFSANPCELQFQ